MLSSNARGFLPSALWLERDRRPVPVAVFRVSVCAQTCRKCTPKRSTIRPLNPRHSSMELVLGAGRMVCASEPGVRVKSNGEVINSMPYETTAVCCGDLFAGTAHQWGDSRRTTVSLSLLAVMYVPVRRKSRDRSDQVAAPHRLSTADAPLFRFLPTRSNMCR